MSSGLTFDVKADRAKPKEISYAKPNADIDYDVFFSRSDVNSRFLYSYIGPHPSTSMAYRRSYLIVVFFFLLTAFLYSTTLRSTIRSSEFSGLHDGRETVVPEKTLKGPAIASKLGNATEKAELGRAAWKLFHTVFARFPDEPSKDESEALRTYIYLFQRLYPCGECATHFGQILAKFPPQVKSRSTAAAWGCHVHNEVNKHLHKNIFDCSKIGDFYDCGCGDDDQIKKQTTSGDSKPDMTAEQVERITGSNGRDVDEDILTGKKPVPRDVTNHDSVPKR